MEQHFSKPEKKIYSFLCLITILGGVFFGYIVSEVKNFSGLQNLKKFQPSVPTRVYDVNGELIAEIFKEQRDIVDFDDVPKAAVNAFLATEDQEFYEHFGINPLAITRAMAKNVLAGRIKQGGSTITQQLAKRLFTQGEKKFSRKILEAILTLQIEKYFSKNEILEMYFNQIYLGHGCYGLNAASKLFFNKEAKYLTAAEASVLAALPSAPGRYSPLDNPHNAYDKNPDILGRMVSEGYLTREYADKIYEEFWPKYIDSILMEFPTKTAYTKIENNAPHFVDYVRQILESRFGREAVYEDGLIVYTTLDLKKQFAAQKYLEEGVERQDIISSRANSYSNGGVDRGLFGTYYTLRSIFSLPNVLIKNDIDTILRKKIIDDEIDEMDILTFFSDSANLNKTAEIFRTGTALSISSSLKVQG
ncbi:MAG: transglycosylase domain-containing protein, partial [Spirochaetes bacterium]|nr:transglycosylase domain-containing protein [Spirochaetota bacterium]